MSDTLEFIHQRVIGGVFGLPYQVTSLIAPSGNNLDFQRPESLRMANARSAIYLLGQYLRPRKVWLPSYLCTAVVLGFRESKVPIEFFSVNSNLICEDTRWLERIHPGDLVLRIHYFGFLNTDSVFNEAVSRGARLIDDAAQALLTKGVGDFADFLIYSPRKFLGTPDGGILVPMSPVPIDWPSLQAVPSAWWLEAFTASQLRRDFDLGSNSRDWFSKFQHAEQLSPIGLFAMSEFSGHLLEHAFDYHKTSSIRRTNYLHLLKHLHNFALFPELPDEVVPLGFPVRLHNRNAIRQALILEKVFPPVHWALDGLVPNSFAASHAMSKQTMTLPCDQRYNIDDMQRICDVFLRNLRQSGA
jgi:hypothetical protein